MGGRLAEREDKPLAPAPATPTLDEQRQDTDDDAAGARMEQAKSQKA